MDMHADPQSFCKLAHELFICVRFGAAQAVVDVEGGECGATGFAESGEEGDRIRASRDGDADVIAGREQPVIEEEGQALIPL
jgi:hypothetical protein